MVYGNIFYDFFLWSKLFLKVILQLANGIPFSYEMWFLLTHMINHV